MGLGRHLRELSRLRVGMAVSVTLALLVAVWSVAEISLFPPKLETRSLEMATAFTQVVVDTPNSAILDLRQGVAEIDSLKNRALLVGNIIGSPPVRAHIARRAGVPADAVQVVTPRTPDAPRAPAKPGQKKGPSDILRSTDHYRLDIQTNPTVPVLDIYAQAPTARSAEILADSAVSGLDDYLRHEYLKDAAGSPPTRAQVELRQLGAARGAVLNDGVGYQVAILAFLGMFALSSALMLAIARVRRGWDLAGAPRWSS
jgi:hypothetical protein